MTADKDALLREAHVALKFPQTYLAEDRRNLAARITAALAENDKGGCKWSPDDDFELGDTWHGECGAIWTFTDGGPAENALKFCPECGGSVLPPLPKGE